MKAFFFKEDRLLKLRKQQVVLAELGVAKAAREVADSKKAVEQIIARINDMDQQLGSAEYTIKMHANQVAIHMRSQLESFRAQRAEKQQRLTIALQGLRKANRAVESLAALETRKKQKHTREQQRQEQASIDSISTRKWVEKGTIHV